MATRHEPADEAFVTALAETTQCLVCVFDRDGRILRFNRACEELTGRKREDVLGRDAREIVIPPEDVPLFGPFLEEVWATGNPSPRDGEWLTKDGSRRLISWANEPVRGPDGEIDCLVTTGLDITERERRAEKLGKLAAEQAALRRVAVLVASDTPPDAVFEAVAEEICGLLGIPSVVILRFEQDAPATIVGHFSNHDTPSFEVGGTVALEPGLSAEHVYRTGSSIRVEDYSGLAGEVAQQMRSAGYESTIAVPIRLAGATWGALIAALRPGEMLPSDTERRMEAFADLVALVLTTASARQALNASRARIVEASDHERRRLERNLHDGAQQRLVAVSITLRMAKARAHKDPDAVASLLENAELELGEAIKELRALAQGLHPAVLVDRGLRAALEALTARATFPVELLEVPEERLPEAVEVAVYYVASEALANAAKYAHATHATARVVHRDGLVVVEITDDGRGGATLAGGTGLRGLSDRVETLGGQLLIQSPPGEGTTVRAELPVEA
ncbi:MAG TPA: PAS domain S-box protein [Solirubrobacteraceae bacterium]|nr:PAS domain S-box protein [Solirubrobacteraceae bacterium]